ncbi:glutamyl-tRNA reductase [bacterium]
MNLVLAGINHETAPVEYRERLAFSDSEAEQALLDLQQEKHISEAILLSTCNRTELYVVYKPSSGLKNDEVAGALIESILAWKNAEDMGTNSFYIRYDTQAARHLFRVSAGLESMIKGEAQILAQVKEAYRIGCKVRICGTILHKLMHLAFRAGKRARTETDIGIGAVSVSLAAVELAERIFRDLPKKNALVIGAGEMAGLTAQHFTDKGIKSLTVANRTEENARALAAKLGAAVAPFSNLTDAVADADVVIVSTAASLFLITPQMMRTVMKIRRNRPVFVMDISVPRNVDPEIGRVYNVFSHDIDDLQQIVDKNNARRSKEIPKVERIIEMEIGAFIEWLDSLQVAPTIKDLVGHIDEIRREEIEKNAKHFSDEQLEQVDMLTRSLVKKILHDPITRLRTGNGGDDEDTPFWVDTVRKVFNLEKNADE